MIEIRNDFLLDDGGQVEWAERLSASLVHAAAH
jgi:predicted N-formylglutamate amidohydrolase